MNSKNHEYVAAFVILLFGGGAFALYLSIPAFLSGGSWQDALQPAFPMLASMSLIFGIALFLRRRRVHGLWPFHRGSTWDIQGWVFAVFYWLTIAPVVFLTSLGLFAYPFEIVTSLIWPGERPVAVVFVGWVLLAAAAAAGLTATWLIWRRFRPSASIASRGTGTHAA